MSGYYMKEIWTPLKLVGIKIFKTEENRIFMKFLKKPRMRIF
ncbi:MAG: hypothetical protein ACQEWI_20555 [Bacillota bacterium]